MKKLFGKGDLTVIAVIIVACILLCLPRLFKNDSPIAEIYVGKEKTQEIKLNDIKEKYTLTPVDGVKISVEQGKIGFVDSDCKDKICVNTGSISTNGQTSACLPNEVVIVITSDKNSDVVLTY